MSLAEGPDYSPNPLLYLPRSGVYLLRLPRLFPMPYRFNFLSPFPRTRVLREQTRSLIASRTNNREIDAKNLMDIKKTLFFVFFLICLSIG